MTSKTTDKLASSRRKVAEIKVDIEFQSLKYYIRNIKSELPRAERFLIAQWLKKLKKPQTLFRADYISRLYMDIVHGYLCPPFSSEPPLGELEPLPPAHTHTSSECCTSLSSIVTNDTSFDSLDLKNTSSLELKNIGDNRRYNGGNGKFTGGNCRYSGGNHSRNVRFADANDEYTGANGKYSGEKHRKNVRFTDVNVELSDETPSTSLDSEDITNTSNEENDDTVCVRSEPNLIKSKFHLASRYISRIRNDNRLEETHEGNLVDSLKDTRDSELNTKDYGSHTEDHKFHSKRGQELHAKDIEFKQKGFEKGKPGTDRSGITTEDRIKIGDGIDNEMEIEVNESEEDMKDTRTINSFSYREGVENVYSAVKSIDSLVEKVDSPLQTMDCILSNTDSFDLINTSKHSRDKTTDTLPIENSLEKIFEKFVEQKLVTETCNLYKSKDGGEIPKKTLKPKESLEIRLDSRPPMVRIREVLMELSNETHMEESFKKQQHSKLPIAKGTRESLLEISNETKIDEDIKNKESKKESPNLTVAEYSSVPIGKEIKEVFVNKNYNVERESKSLEPNSSRDGKDKCSLGITQKDTLELTSPRGKKYIVETTRKSLDPNSPRDGKEKCSLKITKKGSLELISLREKKYNLETYASNSLKTSNLSDGTEKCSLKITKQDALDKKYGMETAKNSFETRSLSDGKNKFSLGTTKKDSLELISFRNRKEKCSLEIAKENSLEPCSLRDKNHIQDVIKKIVNLYQRKHQDKIIDLENKIAKITTLNEQLTDANLKNKSQIEELQKELGCLKRRHSIDDAGEMRNPINHTESIEKSGEIKNAINDTEEVDGTTFNIHCKDTSDNTIGKGNTSDNIVSKRNETISEIIDTISVLLEKSNRHIEKLGSLSDKFNLIKNDYELERKEMILKFKSIDSLHQNILTELIKQRVNEGQENEDRIDKYRVQLDEYRVQLNEKNAEISKLQNTQCDACATKRRRNEIKNKEDETNGGTIEELKKEVAQLGQVNKEIIYNYEKKIKKLMNEKTLEGKLMNTLLKAQKEEIEIYLTGQKHEELRRLADNLESQYSRIVDDAIRVAKSQHGDEIGTK